MSTGLNLMSVQDTIAGADALYRQADSDKLDPRRVATHASANLILSMVVLIGQLDRIAQAAALQTARAPSFDEWTALQEQLVAAGYLPLPATPTNEEPAHGEG